MAPLLVVVAFAFLNACSAPKAQPSGAPPPIPVNVAVAMQETVPVDIQAIGTVASSATVQVKSQIAGELLSVDVKPIQPLAVPVIAPAKVLTVTIVEAVQPVGKV